MARIGFMKTRINMHWDTKPLSQGFSKISGTNCAENSSRANNKNNKRDDDDKSCWIPHPRTGIYFPEGHEQVMENVPNNAASFEQTYWLRDVEGVDKAHRDIPTYLTFQPIIDHH